MIRDSFVYLQDWYCYQIDGAWECRHGIKIEMTQQTDWLVCISLEDTLLQDKYFDEVIVQMAKKDWFHCTVKEGFFIGLCSLCNIFNVFKTFQEWSEGTTIAKPIKNKDFKWLCSWVVEQNKLQTTHPSISISTIYPYGWSFCVYLQDMQLEKKELEECFLKHSAGDWIPCEIGAHHFESNCSPLNLSETISIFRQWICDQTLFQQLEKKNEGSHDEKLFSKKLNQRKFNTPGDFLYWHQVLKKEISTSNKQE